MKQPEAQQNNPERPPALAGARGYAAYEVSANDFIEAQTKQIEREFKCSKPRPRNRAMGFKGSDKPKRPWKHDAA